MNRSKRKAWEIAMNLRLKFWKMGGLLLVEKGGCIKRIYRKGWLSFQPPYQHAEPGDVIAEYAEGEQTPHAWGLAVMRRKRIEIVPLDAERVGDGWRLRLRYASGELVVPDLYR